MPLTSGRTTTSVSVTAICATFQRPPRRCRRRPRSCPKRAIYRFNLALYRAYAGDFAEAEKEVRTAQELNPKYEKGYMTLAFAQLGQGRLEDAAKSYGTLATFSPRGTSLAGMGLADVALYEGRFRDAIRGLEAGQRKTLRRSGRKRLQISSAR